MSGNQFIVINHSNVDYRPQWRYAVGMTETVPYAPAADMRNPVATHMGYLLRRASAMMMAELGASLAQIDLRPVESTIVMLIAVNPGCTQSQVGRMLGIKRANMVPLIAALIGKGLVEKARVDGRTHALYMSDAGMACHARITQVVELHEARFDELLGDHDRDDMMAVLRRITESTAKADT